MKNQVPSEWIYNCTDDILIHMMENPKSPPQSVRLTQVIAKQMAIIEYLDKFCPQSP